MTQKDLIRLPLGKYNLTDGIWRYNLKKLITPDGKVMYSIIEPISRQHFALFERNEDVFDDSDKYKQKRLSGCMSVGGLHIYSTDVYDTIRPLKIIKNSTYKKFMLSINENC